MRNLKKAVVFLFAFIVFFTFVLNEESLASSVLSLDMKEILWDKASQFKVLFQETQSDEKAVVKNKPSKTIRIVGGGKRTAFYNLSLPSENYIKVTRSNSGITIKIKCGQSKSLPSRGASFINKIVSTAAGFLGVPYLWGGSTSSGFDCSGFVMKVFQLNGILLNRTADQQYYAGNYISRDQLKSGDLVFFTTYCPGVSHVGIYIGGDRFIHSSSSSGMVRISSLKESYYDARYVGAARY